MKRISDETINRWFGIYAELELPIGYYNITPDYGDIRALGRMTEQEWKAKGMTDEDELELKIEFAIKDAISEDPYKYAQIDAKTRGAANVTAMMKQHPEQVVEHMNEMAKLYPSGRPWADYAVKNLFNPRDEKYDFCIWLADNWDAFESEEQTENTTEQTKTPQKEAGKTEMETTKTPTTTENPTGNLSQYFTRYVDMTLSDGTTPYNGEDVDATYYKTEDGKYAICEITLADYELYEHTEEPRNGFVRMKYALNGPTHKMECSQWMNGFRFDWSGAKALKEMLEINDPTIDQMCAAMTKPCEARFRKMMAQPTEQTETKTEEQPKAEVKAEQPKSETKTTKTFEAYWNGKTEDDIYIVWSNADANRVNVKAIDPANEYHLDGEYTDIAKTDFLAKMTDEKVWDKSDSHIILAAKAAGFSIEFSKTEEVESEDAKAEREAKERAEREAAEAKAKAEREEDERKAAEKKAAEEAAAAAKAEAERKEREAAEAAAKAKAEEDAKRKGRIIDPALDDVKAYIAADEPVLLIGPAGTGKSTIVEQAANEMGMDFYSMGSMQFIHNLEGFIDANGVYHATEFFNAFTKGGVLNLDEIFGNSNEVLVKLNGALAQRAYDFPGQGRIKAHPDFRITATDNTNGKGGDGQYVREKADASSLNRFEAKIFVDYNPEVEMAIAKGDEKLCEFIRDLRDAVEKCSYDEVISYRQLGAIARSPFKNTDIAKVMRHVFIDAMTYGGKRMDDVKMLAAQLAHPYDNEYERMFRKVAMNYNYGKDAATATKAKAVA